MKNLQELAALATAAKENLETAITENVCTEIVSLLARGVSPEVDFTLRILMANQPSWVVSSSDYGIACLLPLEKVERSTEIVEQLIDASEETIGLKKGGICHFIDARFGTFMICYALGQKITAQYSQKSGYGEDATLSVQFQILKNTQVTFVSVEDRFQSVDPVLHLPPCTHPEKMLMWIREGFKS
jgi:hypothetical protein